MAGNDGYGQGHPLFYEAQKNRGRAANAAANAQFDPRRQNVPGLGLGFAPPHGVAPPSAQTDDFNNPVAGSTGVAPHVAARAALGVSGGGAPGSMMAQQQGQAHIAGLMAHLNQSSPELPHMPTVPHPEMAYHPSYAEREGNVHTMMAGVGKPSSGSMPDVPKLMAQHQQNQAAAKQATAGILNQRATGPGSAQLQEEHEVAQAQGARRVGVTGSFQGPRQMAGVLGTAGQVGAFADGLDQRAAQRAAQAAASLGKPVHPDIVGPPKPWSPGPVGGASKGQLAQKAQVAAAQGGRRDVMAARSNQARLGGVPFRGSMQAPRVPRMTAQSLMDQSGVTARQRERTAAAGPMISNWLKQAAAAENTDPRLYSDLMTAIGTAQEGYPGDAATTFNAARNQQDELALKGKTLQMDQEKHKLELERQQQLLGMTPFERATWASVAPGGMTPQQAQQQIDQKKQADALLAKQIRDAGQPQPAGQPGAPAQPQGGGQGNVLPAADASTGPMASGAARQALEGMFAPGAIEHAFPTKEHGSLAAGWGKMLQGGYQPGIDPNRDLAMAIAMHEYSPDEWHSAASGQAGWGARFRAARYQDSKQSAAPFLVRRALGVLGGGYDPGPGGHRAALREIDEAKRLGEFHRMMSPLLQQRAPKVPALRPPI